MANRIEHDELGSIEVPEEVYYGPQTQRARANFPISGLHLPHRFIRSLALVKKASAGVNHELERLASKLTDPIMKAAQEIIDGSLMDQFVVDVFQSGSGTSTNMNMNEVIAGRANELLNGLRGGKSPVHPNDHVNLGQSSNDVIPSALHIAALTGITDGLVPAFEKLARALHEKAAEFAAIRKVGRTHLQDAVPMTLGQEFGGYAAQVDACIMRLNALGGSLAGLTLGGTAVGTGVNTHPHFASAVIKLIARETGLPFRKAADHFAAQGAQDTAVETSGTLKTCAVALAKIANDIRWLGSGPRCGLGEISLPTLQPGSSIMPGKVNPVIPEAVMQVAAQVIGNDTAITLGGQGGTFELNTMLPLIIHNLLQSIDLLSTAASVLAGKCVTGISANPDRCEALVDKSLSLAAFLVPYIGHDRAAAVARRAHETGKNIRDIVLEEDILPAETFDELVKGDP